MGGEEGKWGFKMAMRRGKENKKKREGEGETRRNCLSQKRSRIKKGEAYYSARKGRRESHHRIDEKMEVVGGRKKCNLP